MNNKITFIFSFMAGVAAGLASGAYYFKKRYANMANEEIESVKKTFENMEKITPLFKVDKQEVKPSYTSSINKEEIEKYIKKYQIQKDEIKKDDVNMIKESKVKIINEDEFGILDDYKFRSFVFYPEENELVEANGMSYNPIDMLGVVGAQELDEVEIVYFRDDVNKVYYEVERQSFYE